MYFIFINIGTISNKKKIENQKENNELKGSVINPYTKAEYEDALHAGEWKGGYVEASGYTSTKAKKAASYSESSESSNSSDSMSEVSSPDSSTSAGSTSDNQSSEESNGYTLPEVIVIGHSGKSGNTGYDKSFSDAPSTPSTPSGSSIPSGYTGGGGGGGYRPPKGNNEKYNLDKIINEWIKIRFGKNLLAELNKLKEQGKLKEVDTFESKSLENPKYNSTDKSIYVPTKGGYGESELIHEFIHEKQDVIGILDYDRCASDNEFQAYVLTYILFKSESTYNAVAFPGLYNNDMWKNFSLEAAQFLSVEKNTLWYDPALLDKLSRENLEPFREIFQENCKATNYPPEYFQNTDPNYDYKWENLLNAIGAKKKR